jgi:thioredoxin 1
MNTVQLNENSFTRDVLQSPTPVLVDYWAEWCVPCRAVAPVVESIAEKYAGRLKVGKLNVDQNPNLAMQYNIRSIPTLILFKNGQPAATQIGSVSATQLSAFVEQHL